MLKMTFEKLNTALVFKVSYLMGFEKRITGDTADTYPCTSFSDPDGCLLDHGVLWNTLKLLA